MLMGKSFKYSSRQPLVHRECHQLPKPHMGAPCSFNVDFKMTPNTPSLCNNTIQDLPTMRTHTPLFLKKDITSPKQSTNNKISTSIITIGNPREIFSSNDFSRKGRTSAQLPSWYNQWSYMLSLLVLQYMFELFGELSMKSTISFTKSSSW